MRQKLEKRRQIQKNSDDINKSQRTRTHKYIFVQSAVVFASIDIFLTHILGPLSNIKYYWAYIQGLKSYVYKIKHHIFSKIEIVSIHKKKSQIHEIKFFNRIYLKTNIIKLLHVEKSQTKCESADNVSSIVKCHRVAVVCKIAYCRYR